MGRVGAGMIGGEEEGMGVVGVMEGEFDSASPSFWSGFSSGSESSPVLSKVVGLED